MRVICLGTNPSEASPDTSAFHPDTKSRQILDRWFDGLEIDLYFANICDTPTPKNRPLRVSEIQGCLPDLSRKIRGFDRIIALGKQASKAVSMLKINYLEMPHPSGLNRQLNDPEFVKFKIEELRKYING